MVRGVIFAILISLQGLLLGQVDIAQLKSQLQSATGTQKVQILNQLAIVHLDRSADMTIYYANEALREAKELEKAYLNQSFGNQLYLPQIIRFQAEACLNLGRAYKQKDKRKEAKRYFQEAQRLARKGKHDDLLGQAIDEWDGTRRGPDFEKILTGVLAEKIDDLEKLVEGADGDEEIMEITKEWAIERIQPRAESAARKGDHEKAIYFYESLIPFFKGESEKLAETHEKLSEQFLADNQPRKAQEHKEIADRLSGRLSRIPAPPTPSISVSPPPPKQAPKVSLDEAIDQMTIALKEEPAPIIGDGAVANVDEEILLEQAQKHAEQGNLKASLEDYQQYAAILKYQEQRQKDSLLISKKIQEVDRLLYQQALQEAEAERFQATRTWLFVSLGLIVLIAALLTSLFLNKQKAHTRMKQAYDQLADTHSKLKSAQTQLVSAEKMVSLGQLTAGIAHEINNPVNFISGNITPLKHDVQDLLTILNAYEQAIDQANLEERFKSVEKLREELEIDYVTSEIEELLEGIDEGASRTTEIVKGLRTFARLDDGDWKRFDLHNGLDSTLALLKNRLDNVDLLKDYGNIPEIEGYPGKLNQVFMNLITNAIQAMPDGGLIHLITYPYPDEIEVRIRDTGKGIPEEIRNRIFEPFFTTKDVGEGTGLGLSISHGIIQQHGGTIKIESHNGQGTEVIIRLPIHQEMAKTEEQVETV